MTESILSPCSGGRSTTSRCGSLCAGQSHISSHCQEAKPALVISEETTDTAQHFCAELLGMDRPVCLTLRLAHTRSAAPPLLYNLTLATNICCWFSICCCCLAAISWSSERVSSTRGLPPCGEQNTLRLGYVSARIIAFLSCQNAHTSLF